MTLLCSACLPRQDTTGHNWPYWWRGVHISKDMRERSTSRGDVAQTASSDASFFRGYPPRSCITQDLYSDSAVQSVINTQQYSITPYLTLVIAKDERRHPDSVWLYHDG